MRLPPSTGCHAVTARVRAAAIVEIEIAPDPRARRDVRNVLEEIAVGDVQARSKQGGDDA
jgi:hypothetical protein